jgi:hypothetical protein
MPRTVKRAIASCAVTAVALYGCGSPNAARTLPFDSVSNRVAHDAGHVAEILYVGDDDQGEVHSYNYKTGAHNGLLKFLSNPQGQCVDAKGNVFVASFGNRTVVEYRRGEIHPLKTFKTSGSPVDCSVAPNGDLAVANRYTPTSLGDVDIFKRAQGKPRSYSNAACSLVGADGYDGSGNLYVQSGNYTTATACELPAGSTSMRAVTLSVTMNSPGGVMWDGQNITMATSCDSSCGGTLIYQMQEDTSGNLTAVSHTVLATDGCSKPAAIRFPFILGKVNTPENHTLATAVVGGSSGGYRCDFVSVWKYPGGGKPSRTIKIAKIAGLNGQSVSIAQ